MHVKPLHKSDCLTTFLVKQLFHNWILLIAIYGLTGSLSKKRKLKNCVTIFVVPELNTLQAEFFLNSPLGLSSPDRAGRILSFCAAGFACPPLLLSLHQVVGPTHSPRYRSSELKT